MTEFISQATDAAAPENNNSTVKLLRLPQVLELIPVSRSHWWAGVASGKFPAGKKLSPRVTYWTSDDIQNLIASLK